VPYILTARPIASSSLVQLRTVVQTALVTETDGTPVASRLNRDLVQATALIASLLARLDKFVVQRDQRRRPGRPPISVVWDGKNALG
jgi:hypothetical protein